MRLRAWPQMPLRSKAIVSAAADRGSSAVYDPSILYRRIATRYCPLERRYRPLAASAAASSRWSVGSASPDASLARISPVFTEQTHPKNVLAQGTQRGKSSCSLLRNRPPPAPPPRAQSPRHPRNTGLFPPQNRRNRHPVGGKKPSHRKTPKTPLRHSQNNDFPPVPALFFDETNPPRPLPFASSPALPFPPPSSSAQHPIANCKSKFPPTLHPPSPHPRPE